VKWSFRNLLAISSVAAIFATVWGIGAGLLNFASELAQGMIIGGVMQWGAWIYMFYYRKKGPSEEESGGGAPVKA